MSWDTPEVSLPPDLLTLWQRALTGTRKVDLKAFLDGLPIWKEVPTRAPENNHRGDGKGSRDKLYRYWSQMLLHLIRSQAVLHSILRNFELEDCISLSQQHFQLLAELYTKMLEERKKSSIPNSVVSQTNVLFNREDLANDSQQQKINRAGPITFRGGKKWNGVQIQTWISLFISWLNNIIKFQIWCWQIWS